MYTSIVRFFTNVLSFALSVKLAPFQDKIYISLPESKFRFVWLQKQEISILSLNLLKIKAKFLDKGKAH